MTKPLTYKIGADLGDLRRKMEEAGSLTKKARQELRQMEQQQAANRQAMSDLGISVLSFGAAATLGLGMAVREAVKWESAFAGVKKTVDGSDEEIAALEGELRQLAKTLPATHEEIAAVAEAAGQLGIKRQDIAEFTRTMIDLGETTNLTADQAATSLAQFMNIMGTSASDVDRLGAALVALGNAGASTEQDILAMGLRIAGAGHQVGMSEDEVLGFASALSSVGIEAEAGGSSFSRVMIDISSAVNDGGQKIADFATVAGMSTAKFSKLFKEDAAGAIIAFIQGLGRMSAAGGNVLGTLERLDFTEIRVRDALLRAAGASDMFTDSLKVGSRGWEENTALAAEAAKRYETTEAQMQIALNAIKDAAIDVGATLLPILQGGVEAIRNLITWWQNLPAPIQTAVTVLGAVTAAVTVLGGAALIAVPKLLAFRESMRTMATTGGGLVSGLGKFGLFMSGPWGAAIGLGVTLLAAFGIASGGAQQRQQELADAGKSVAQAIAEQNGEINKAVRQTTAKQLAEKGLLQTAKALGVSLPQVTAAVLDQGKAYDSLKGYLERMIDAKEADLRTSQDRSGKTQEALQGEIDQYSSLLNGINEMRGGKEKELLAQQAAAEGAKEGTVAAEGQASALQELGATAEEAAEALDAMIDMLDRLNGVTLSHREAQRSLVQAVQDANGVFKDNVKTLDIHTEQGMENAEALDGVASAMNDAAEAAAREAESVGGATAGNAALTASLQSSRDQLFQIARQFFKTNEEAWAYVDSVLAIPPEASTEILTPGSEAAQIELQRVRDAVRNIPPEKDVNVGVLSQEAIKKLQDLGFKVRTLPDGTVAVQAQTADAQRNLNNFVNANKNKTFTWAVRITMPNIRGPAGLSPDGGYAYGGIHRFAGGGMFGPEDHRPQIAMGSDDWRVWAEKETHKESYIPWAPDRRGPATTVLRTTADGFGYALVPKSQLVRSYAHGGIGGYGGGGDMLAGCNVQVFIGDRELTDIVDVRVTARDRQLRRDIVSGSGNTR